MKRQAALKNREVKSSSVKMSPATHGDCRGWVVMCTGIPRSLIIASETDAENHMKDLRLQVFIRAIQSGGNLTFAEYCRYFKWSYASVPTVIRGLCLEFPAQ